MSVNLDAGTGIAASAGPGAELEEAPIEWHGVVVLDGALVLEAADAIEISLGRRCSPGGLGVRRRLSEASVVAREKPAEHALSLRERARLGEPELDDKAILEGAEEPFDPPLRLRRPRADPTDAEFLEGAPDLGGLGPALELLGHGERGAGITVEDPVAVGVGRGGETIAPDELAEEQEVTVGILLQAEDAAEDLTRRIVDGCVEHEPRPAIFEPGVMAAVHLDEEAGLGHAFPTAAMTGWAAGTRAADALGAQQPLHGRAGQPQALAFLEQVREMVIVHARIDGASQGEDAGSHDLGHAPSGGATAVPMGQSREALLAQAGQ